MTGTVQIRPYGPADARACAGIFARAWAAGHPHAPRRIDLAAFIQATEGELLLVAEDPDGLPLGFVAIHEAGAFVHHLYVDPPSSGRGVGRALLAAALARAGGRASLKCQLRNGRALAFYAREGWTRGETGWADGEPWVRMLSPR